MPPENHPIWKLAQGLILAGVLCFALSPYSGLYNSWKPADAITVISALAAWLGGGAALDRIARGGNNSGGPDH